MYLFARMLIGALRVEIANVHKNGEETSATNSNAIPSHLTIQQYVLAMESVLGITTAHVVIIGLDWIVLTLLVMVFIPVMKQFVQEKETVSSQTNVHVWKGSLETNVNIFK